MNYLSIRIVSIFIITFIQVVNVSAEEVLPAALNDDVEKIINARHSFEQMKAYMSQNPVLFLKEKTMAKRLTSREQREDIWLFWKSFLDRMVLLDMIGSKYEQLYKKTDGQNKQQIFRVAYAVFLLQYRYAVEIISALENDPSMHTMLNEPVPELGLAKNTYTQIKFRFLNVVRATEFTRLSTVYAFYGKDDELRLTPEIKDDSIALLHLGVGEGAVQTLKNALIIVQDAGFTAWFPLQASVSEWMGDVKVLRVNQSLISDDQISDMEEILLPGDILLERREWYISNIGLPGYWPHAALYVGTAEQRSTYFNEHEVKQHYAKEGGFETALKTQYPVAYSASFLVDAYGHIPKVIEAISEGVSFTSMEHSVDADSVAILRPKLSKLEKARAIQRAFHFIGRPYDFDFDFLTDAELVCTELIYKVYEPAEGITGLNLPTRKILGRTVTTANDITKLFDDEFKTDSEQFEFIIFYDGHERKKSAVKSNVEVFKGSWKRSKMFIWIQDTASDSNHN